MVPVTSGNENKRSVKIVDWLKAEVGSEIPYPIPHTWIVASFPSWQKTGGLFFVMCNTIGLWPREHLARLRASVLY